MMKILIALVTFLALGLADKVPATDCGSTSGAIDYVDISGCTKFPCDLKQGTDVGVELSFKSKVDTSKVSVVVHGYLGPLPVPFPVDQPDACQSGVKCPVSNGDSNVYTAKLPVSKHYPRVKVVVKWELKDENSNDLACFKVPVQIVA